MLATFSPFEGAAASAYRPVPAIYGRADAASGAGIPPMALFGGAGTGGLESEAFYRARQGYQTFLIIERPTPAMAASPFVELMTEVKAGFGRTMSRLPEVFGVSRQSLYNWLDGETPKDVHHAKLEQLAAAARVFTELGFKPTSATLDRTVAQGKSLLQLLSEGADGKEAAKKLVRIVQRGADSRAKLDALLGDRKARPEASDMGTPSLNEEV